MNNSFILQYNMLPPGTAVLCAVSGGADSMCMLHMLASSAAELKITVAAANFEHGIRGEESLRDSNFVKEYCVSKSIPFFQGSADVPVYASENGISVEDAARKLRYGFLEKTAIENGFTRIATAHNADDNAETVIFNMIRGTGIKGLCGIPPVRGMIIRPILDMTRAEIERYLLENGIPHVDDSTNSSDDYSRNRIRHHVMPVLKEINPALSKTVLRNGQLLRSDGEYLDHEAEQIISGYTDGSVPCRVLQELPFAVASRVVRILSGKSLPAVHTGDILQFAGGTGYGILALPELTIRREAGQLYFKHSCVQPAVEYIPDRELIPGQRFIVPEAGLEISADVTDCSSEVHTGDIIIRLNYESIAGKVICSSRKPGDSILPAGRGCRKTLKALFLEKKYTQTERNLTPVFRDEKGLIAVAGIAVEERCRCIPGCRVLEITVHKI